MATYIANPWATNSGGTITSTQWVAMKNSAPKIYKKSSSNTMTTNTVQQVYLTNPSSTSQIIVNQAGSSMYWMGENGRSGTIQIEAGQAARIELPDGAILDVKADGSYEIVDKDAKVTYKANRVREFNRYVNASDLLEEFIDFVDGVGGITKERFLALPIETFIRWLVLRAAQADGDEVEQERAEITQSVLALPTPTPRLSRNCKCCGRFVSRRRVENAMQFCSAEHFAQYEQRVFLA